MRRLCIFAAGFSVAIGCCVLFRMQALIAGAACLTLSLGLFFVRGGAARRCAIACLGLGVGLMWYAGYAAIFLRPAIQADGQTRQLVMTATGYPEPTRYGASVDAQVRLDGRRYDAVVYLRESEPQIRPGDMLQLEAALALTNGEAGEESVYLRARGTMLVAKARSDVQITPGKAAALRHLPVYCAHAMQQKIAQLFPTDTVGFMTALLTGRRAEIAYQTQTELSIAGIYHVVAVSGMHVSILLGMILLLCGSRRRLAAAIGVPAVVFFVMMTGARASAVRAGCMQILLLLAPLARRESDTPTSICAALMLLLAANPWAALDVGLQLSFASVTGIFLFSSRICQWAGAWRWLRGVLGRKSLLSGLVRTMLSCIACSLGVMAMSLPLSAGYFGVAPLLAPVSNVLCLWAVTLVFAAGLVICVTGFVLGPLMLGAAWLAAWPVRWIMGVCSVIGRIPGAALYLENGYMWAILAMLYLALLVLILRPKAAWRRLAAVSLAVGFLAVQALAYFDYHLPQFTFSAVDVGQGQCLVYTCGSRTCVIDCGGVEDESGELAARFLQSYGEFHIQALVLTHYDADHVNGVQQLLRRMRVDTLYVPQAHEQTALGEALIAQAARRDCEVVFVHEDMQVPLGAAELQIFAPVSDDSANDCGLSVLASRGEYDILITGDMTQRAEWRLLSTRALPDIELFVAGHHGSKDSTSEALLALTRPELAIISVGKDNTFGHPADETLQRLRQAGTVVYRTDRSGTITIRG